MAKLTRIKVKGMAILEPMVALVIISSVVTIASLIFGNVAKKNTNFLLFKAQNQIEILMSDVDVEEAESFGFEYFDIEKELDNYSGLEDVIQVTWVVKNKAEEPIMEQKYLIHK